MRYLLAAPVVLFIAVMAVGAITGRVKARSCCAIPAERDLRLHPVQEQPESALSRDPRHPAAPPDAGRRPPRRAC